MTNDLDNLIHRLKMVQDHETIRKVNSLLDSLEPLRNSDPDLSPMSVADLNDKVSAAEQSIHDGTTISQEEFKLDMKNWLTEQK